MLGYRRALPVLALLISMLTSMGMTPPARAAEPAQLWNDFAHYVLIARPKLASEAAVALVGDVDAGVLLDAVEASDYADNTANVFDRALGMPDVATAAAKLREKIESARVNRSRDAQRITDNINLLDDGQRPYLNAVRRLTAAGQYAAPQLLATLRDPAQANLHPFILRAIADIGRPLVAPLCTALPQLEPVTQGQIAQVLAEIGYPYALAALQEVIENPQADASAKARAQIAFNQLASSINLKPGASAADLYLTLGINAYEAGSAGEAPLGFDASKNVGLFWVYKPAIGLVPLEVPASVYADALARAAAGKALALNHDLDHALTLFLAADLRADNNLGEGESDPSRAKQWQPAEYYALLAGPQRLGDVLHEAITDQDAALALDAIDALAKTASIEALQPLVRGLSYPDRRVRFRSAEALAKAMPTSSFTNDFRVVPVLGEAVRQSDHRYAVVIAPDATTRNKAAAAASAVGMDEVITGDSLAGVASQVAAVPGVDVLVVAGSAGWVAGVVDNTAGDYKLASTPIVAYVSAADQIALNGKYGSSGRLATVVGEINSDTLEPAAAAAVNNFSGDALSAEDTERFPLTALALLEQIAAGQSVYNAQDALPAVAAALADPREAVAIAAGNTIAAMDSPDAQAALAASAVEQLGAVQIAQLNALAASANRFGNLISADQADAILKLVKESDGDLAIAAAQAHGALSLPTANAVELILGQ